MWALTLQVQSRSLTDTKALAACLATDCETPGRVNSRSRLNSTKRPAKTCEPCGTPASGSHRYRLRPAGLRKAFLNLGPRLYTGEPMAQLDQLQLVVAEVQSARQQVSSVRAQVQELEGTIAAVESQPDGLALHRQMGGVLIEVADRAALLADLNETLASLKVHSNGSRNVNSS